MAIYYLRLTPLGLINPPSGLNVNSHPLLLSTLKVFSNKGFMLTCWFNSINIRSTIILGATLAKFGGQPNRYAPTCPFYMVNPRWLPRNK